MSESKWIKDRDAFLEETVSEEFVHVQDYEDALKFATQIADFGRSYEARKVEGLIAALKDLKESIALNVVKLGEINFEVHGDLYGCDCGDYCDCKPRLWLQLEDLKYHNLGVNICIDETLTNYETSSAKADKGDVE